MTTSPGSIVFKDSLFSRFAVPEGTRAQAVSFKDLSTTPRIILNIIPSQKERLFVFGYRPSAGGSLPQTTSSSPATRIFFIFLNGASAIITVYVPAGNVSVALTWSAAVVVQGYQVPFIETIPRLPGNSRSGSLIFTYGSVITGGVQTLAQSPGTVTPVVPSGVLTITLISGPSNITLNGVVVYIGQMFDASVSYTIGASVPGGTLSFSIFVPPTKTGVLPQPTSSSIKTFSFQGRSYRPGEIYPGNENLATSVLINGVRRSIIVPGARIV